MSFTEMKCIVTQILHTGHIKDWILIIINNVFSLVSFLFLNEERLMRRLTCRGGDEGACSAVRASTTSLAGPWPMVLTAATRKS